MIPNNLLSSRHGLLLVLLFQLFCIHRKLLFLLRRKFALPATTAKLRETSHEYLL